MTFAEFIRLLLEEMKAEDRWLRLPEKNTEDSKES